MDERLLLKVMVRLVQIQGELGDEVYRDAVRGALVAIGRAAMRAAEGEVDLGNIVMFPPDPNAYDWDDGGGVA